MDLAEHIRRIQSWEPLDWTEAIQRTLLRCYPPRKTALRPSRQQPVARRFDEQAWAAGLEASGLVAIAEHLYPMECAQRQMSGRGRRGHGDARSTSACSC